MKREIEYDPFCAKKYVLDNCYRNLPIDDRYICEYLEKKLFSITSLKEKLNGNEAIHIKKVCLQNFRGFKGKAELNLHDSKGNAASFVLIYAPNGCGKTSIFDGIEYALKGKVDYLIETKKISNFRGFIYHNRDNYLQDASVELLLDDGRSILRKVAPVNEDGDDCRGGSMDEIYQKIDAHDVMKHLRYELSFNDNQKGELVIHAMENIDENAEDSNYRPEIYFSTAQLNTVAFSSFFSRALNSFSKLPIQSIFIDDPIGSYDDMNALGFADLIRSLLENSKCQIIMSTHDETIFKILQRKLDNRYYSSCFIELPYGNGIKWEI